MFNPWWCIACVLCGSFPEWPEEGNADKEWVIEAVEWRLDRGIDGCTDITEAIDAWSLEWIANSSEVRVEVDTEYWTIFNEEPALQPTLIQIIALESLLEHKESDKKVLRKLKRFAKRSEGVLTADLKYAFDKNLETIKAAEQAQSSESK